MILFHHMANLAIYFEAIKYGTPGYGIISNCQDYRYRRIKFQLDSAHDTCMHGTFKIFVTFDWQEEKKNMKYGGHSISP